MLRALLCIFFLRAFANDLDQSPVSFKEQVILDDISQDLEGYVVKFRPKNAGTYSTYVLELKNTPKFLQYKTVYNVEGFGVMSEFKGVLSIRQILIQLPTPQGESPFWLVSRKQKKIDFSLAPLLLDQHAPATDYIIL